MSAGIVHLGLGAFFRAHGAIYIEDAMRASGGDWGIVGVSLRSPAVRDALAPQDFAYTALSLAPDGPVPRRIDVLQDVLVAPEEPGAVLAVMAEPNVKIVSLTVTEKGYCHAPATGALNVDHPDIVHDLTSDHPVSAPGFLVRALQRRMAAGRPPFTILSCDNLPDNGRLVRGVVLELARRIDPALADWIEGNARFPATMVDRITPATTATDIARVEQLTGLKDAAPVVHEPFRQWVVEDDFVGGARPDLAAAGVELVPDVAPYEHMKLRMLNGTHSTLAYLGYLAGHRTIAATVADPPFRDFLGRIWAEEIAPTVTAPEGVSLAEYAATLTERYTNPAIEHLTWQIAMDGSQKLPQRLLGPLVEGLAAGRPAPRMSLAVAAWMRYVGGTDEQGAPIDVRDPLAPRLKALCDEAKTPEAAVDALLGVRDVFPPKTAALIRTPVQYAYAQLLQSGARACVAAL